MLTLGIIAKHHAVAFQRLVCDALPYVQQVVVAVDDDAEPGILGYRSDRVEYIEQPLAMNFSAMRNAVCDRVREDWVLFLDTDENMKPETWPLVASWLDRPEDVIMLPRCNYFLNEDGTVMGPSNFPDWQPKLHRRHVRWHRPVHEWPEGDVSVFRLPPEPDLAIQHVKTHQDQHYANELYANIYARSHSN